MFISDGMLLAVAVMWGAVWLMFLMIYEEVLTAFEGGLKESIKKKVDNWKRKIRNLFSVR